MAIRMATKREMEKEDATTALLRTMQGTRRSALHTCIVRGRAAHVEQHLLERASAKLLRLKVVYPDENRVKKLLQWSLITRGGGEPVVETRCSLENCTVGA